MTTMPHVDLTEMKRLYRLYLNETARVNTRLKWAKKIYKSTIRDAENPGWQPPLVEVPQKIKDRFLVLCEECKVTPEQMRISRFQGRGKYLRHARIYIAWRLYQSDEDATYPVVAAMFGRVGRSHSQTHKWVSTGNSNPKFQRPPQEGEYAN